MKILGQSNLSPKKFLAQKNFRTKKIGVPKHLVSKKISGPEIFRSKISDPEIISEKKSFGFKRILVPIVFFGLGVTSKKNQYI